MKKSDTIRAAWITSIATVVAAAIVLPLQFCGGPSSQQIMTALEGEHAQTVMLGTAGDVTINYMTTDSAVQETIEFLKEKAAETETTIELTRQDLALLAQALQDLDERTSGLEKLPDGRTQFGAIISGQPTVVIEEHAEASRLMIVGEYVEAIEHSQNAIGAYEETNEIPRSLSSGELTPQAVAKLYRVGGFIALKLQMHEAAYGYAVQAVDAFSSPEGQALLAVTLFNTGRVEEAVVAITKALEDDPNNAEYLQLRTEMTQ